MNGLARVFAVALVGVLFAGCRSTPSQGEAPVPDIPPPVHRTPTITLPPATVSRPPSLQEQLAHVADSLVQSPVWQSAHLAMLVVDAQSGDTLLSRNANKLMIPASNQKLLTAAIALNVLGESYRWRTPVLLHGRLAGTTWKGDLIVVGSGDPTWSDSLRGGNALAAFHPIVDALKARGIDRVDGRVLAGGDYFSGATFGSGWEVEDLDGVFGAAVDELMLNEGALHIEVIGGSHAGSALQVVRRPTSRYPRVVVQGTTANTGATPIRVLYDSTGSAIVVTGTLRIGERARFNRAYRHPADAVRAAIGEALVAAGIRVDTSLAVTRRDSARLESALTTADTLVVLESPSLADVLPRMQKPSQNQIAEVLLRTSGRVASNTASTDSARAVAARTLASLGVDARSIVYRDGSGMSRHNFVTATAIVRVLDAMRQSPHFDVYRRSLPVAGTDGTLQNRMRGTSAAGNVHAKTGSLDKVRALSGYATSADNRVLLFSFIANNYATTSRDVDQMHELLVNLLVSSRAGVH